MPDSREHQTISGDVPDDAIMHVYPIGDLREHDTNGRGKCWCRPSIEDAGSEYLVVHNSLDGREMYEDGRRKPS